MTIALMASLVDILLVIICSNVLEADMRVYEHCGAEDRIHSRVKRARDEGRDRQRDKAERYQPRQYISMVSIDIRGYYRSKSQW
jgi:hypothetical protein